MGGKKERERRERGGGVKKSRSLVVRERHRERDRWEGRKNERGGSETVGVKKKKSRSLVVVRSRLV